MAVQDRIRLTGSLRESPAPAGLFYGPTCRGVNRPPNRTSIDISSTAAVEELDGDDELRLGILTGTGNGFSAGMDLKALVRGEGSWVEERGWAGITRKRPETPMIAAVEGFALAGGLEIALSCDLIVAARDARLGIPEVKRGLVTGAGGLLRLPNRIPYHVAMELAITGEPISGERAHELGLVNAACDPGEALSVALELAAVIAGNAPLAVAASKSIVRDAVDWSEREGWDRMGEVVLPAMTSADAMEGAVAFAEKRDPVWKGR